MIVEQLFIGNCPTKLQPQCEGSLREFSPVEENAIYYTAGYIVRKLLLKLRVSDDHSAFVEALMNMIGQDTM